MYTWRANSSSGLYTRHPSFSGSTWNLFENANTCRARVSGFVSRVSGFGFRFLAPTETCPRTHTRISNPKLTGLYHKTSKST